MPVILARASQQAAGYRPEGGVERCGYCQFFVTQGTCNRILGPVSPRGWCRYFSRMVYLRLDGGADNDFTGPAPGATLDISFMSSGTLDPRVTFTRAGAPATYFDATGAMQTIAAHDVPRWDYDPVTHALRGLLIEEGRINLLLNSATLGTQSVAVTAQAYTLSFYGTGTITKSGTATGALAGTGAFPQRVSQTFTPTAGTLSLTVTGTVQNAQLEAGAFPTSYIPTTSTTSSRGADIATIASIPGRNAAAETYEADFMMVTTQETANPRIIADANGTSGPLFQTPAYQMGIYDGVSATQTANSFALGAVAKAASTWTSGSAGVCLNAGAVATSAALTAGFGAVTTFKFLGDAAPTDQSNGYIRRFRYWPRVLTNAEMQSVTT